MYDLAFRPGNRRPFLRIHAPAALARPAHRAAPRDWQFVRLTPSRMPAETKAGPNKGRERDLARPPAGAGCPFEGPAEATEAMREPEG